ncbi:MAG: apolipoprotein N-acyltransferase [Gammaproteobacteria bacterium]|nr:apolipoprotein N-acyltransferase [Gammaproteobacteria bacterium]
MTSCLPRGEYARYLLALIAGAVQPLAFAPFALYPLALLALLPLFALWLQATPRQAAWYGLLFGLGMFGAGVSWVYVAIHVFGHTVAPLAALLTLLFVFVLALTIALAGYLSCYVAARAGLSETIRLLLWFPSVWTLVEWFRGWFLTGFPWLSLGYSQIDSPLRGYAPLLGIYGLSLLCAFSAGVLLWMWRERGRTMAWGVPLLLLIWLGGWGLSRIDWTSSAGEPLRVTLIQGNVPQSTKWDPAAIRLRLTRYAELTREHLGDSDLIIWPENAITVFYHQLAESYFQELSKELRQSGTDLILGVPLLDDDGDRYYTTLMSLGTENGFYRKRHLVPFGEFLPLEGLLRGLINFFEMPMSSFSPGTADQPLLQAAGQPIAASVCYEDAFPAEMRDFLPEATLLVNGSNNAWYGDSLAPHQHLQISRMRALEFGRPMLRATTNGISAIIAADGSLMETSPQFETAIVQARVQPMAGATPYTRFGNYPLLLLLACVIGVTLLPGRRRR